MKIADAGWWHAAWKGGGMVTRRHPRARSFAVLSFVVLANTLGAACTKEDPPSESSVALPSRTTLPEASTDRAAPRIEIGGFLVDELDEPVIGRPVDIVDASGQRFSVITDEGGAFWALGALAPYDVLVAPAPSGAIITPIAYLGLTRRDPRIEVFEHDGPDARPESQLLRVSVTLPPCRAPSGSCFVSIVSASATGRGGTAASYAAGASPTAMGFAVEHAFEKAALASAESVNVHVLVGDADYTDYAYAAATGIEATPGGETDVTLAPSAVAASAPVSVAARSEGVPLGWDWTLASELELLDGAVVSLRYDWTSSSSLRLPLLLGASWRVNAWAQAPREGDDEAPLPRRTSQVRSGKLPVPAANVALDLPTPPLPITLSGETIAWRGEPSLASVIVIDDVRGAQRFRAFTSEASIPLARLTALGLSPLQAGAHTLDLQTTAGADVDALTEPDERVRAERFGVDRPGGATYQRARFVVAP